jgi:hypothetical protein
LRTIAQNGLEAWPWVTMAMRTPPDDRAGAPAVGAPSVTVTVGWRTTVVPPQPASTSSATSASARLI